MNAAAFVILSEAKDLLFHALTREQILRFAQDDKSLRCGECGLL